MEPAIPGKYLRKVSAAHSGTIPPEEGAFSGSIRVAFSDGRITGARHGDLRFPTSPSLDRGGGIDSDRFGCDRRSGPAESAALVAETPELFGVVAGSLTGSAPTPDATNSRIRARSRLAAFMRPIQTVRMNQ